MIKEVIKNLIYYNKNFDLSKYKYKIIESAEELNTYLQKQDYYLSLHVYGINCLLLLFTYEGKKYTIVVNRKSLSFYISQFNINNLIYYEMNEMNDDDELYTETIMDGIYNDGNKMFIITDIYVYKRQNIISEDLASKLERVKNVVQPNKMISINEIYKYSEIMNIIKRKESIRGLIFYPSKSGTKLICNNIVNDIEDIYLFENELANSNNNIDNEIGSGERDNRFIINKDDVHNFILEKTDIVDVYKLYILEDEINDEKKNRQNKEQRYIDIALIPTLEDSKRIQNIMRNNSSKIFECRYDKEREKWIPQKLID